MNQAQTALKESGITLLSDKLGLLIKKITDPLNHDVEIEKFVNSLTQLQKVIPEDISSVKDMNMAHYVEVFRKLQELLPSELVVV